MNSTISLHREESETGQTTLSDEFGVPIQNLRSAVSLSINRSGERSKMNPRNIKRAKSTALKRATALSAERRAKKVT